MAETPAAAAATPAPISKAYAHRPFNPSPEYKINDSVLELVGHTPLVRPGRIMAKEGIKCDIVCKLEYFNAGGSVKDRIAMRMVEDAEASGRIKPGDTLIEPTSGNTGIGLALAAAVKGYRCIITLPEKMSAEKVNLLKGLGAEIIRTPTEAAWNAPESHISVAERLQKSLPNAHILNQYDNPGNPMAHYDGTGEEILYQTDKKIDVVVLGAGTGGTLTGIARKIREHLPGVRIVGVDPHGSDLAVPESLNTRRDSYQVEGIGYDFIPKVLDRSLVDQWYKTDDKESFYWARRLLREEGFLCGGSSGSAFSVAMQEARALGPGKRVVVLLPDSIRNYMSKFLRDDWMSERGFLDVTEIQRKAEAEDKWHGAVVADLKLAAPVTAPVTATCAEAAELLQKHGIDNLPIVSPSGKPVGLLTEGQLLARLASGRVKRTEPVSKAMFKFGTDQHFHPVASDTKLKDLESFFELHSVALVTEKSGTDVEAEHRIVHVCTKIDLLGYLINQRI